MWPARVVSVVVATVAVVIVMLVYCLTLCRAWLCRAVVQPPPCLPSAPLLACRLKGSKARQVTSAQESARTYLFTYQVRGLFSATTRSNNNRSWQPLCSLSLSLSLLPPLMPHFFATDKEKN